MNMRDQYLKWPNEQERNIIKQQIQSISQLPNCVGLIDGTLFPLAFMPSTPDAPDYKGRKHGYSISFIIVCDHNRLITYAYGVGGLEFLLPSKNNTVGCVYIQSLETGFFCTDGAKDRRIGIENKRLSQSTERTDTRWRQSYQAY